VHFYTLNELKERKIQLLFKPNMCATEAVDNFLCVLCVVLLCDFMAFYFPQIAQINADKLAILVF
jgi:hypothetical protein